METLVLRMAQSVCMLDTPFSREEETRKKKEGSLWQRESLRDMAVIAVRCVELELAARPQQTSQFCCVVVEGANARFFLCVFLFWARA